MCTSLDGIYLVPYKLHIMISVCLCVRRVSQLAKS